MLEGGGDMEDASILSIMKYPDILKVFLGPLVDSVLFFP